MLRGGGGNDRLFGGRGDDGLNGGSGNDVLDGGSGDDRMAGGHGADTFVFAAHSKGDVDAIADFEPGIDRLQFSGVSHFGELKLGRGMENGMGFAELEWQTRSVRMEGVEIADLTQDMFTFV